MKPIAIIPARYASTRFPGKPLVMIKGKPMIQLVYEQSRKFFNQVVVATDDDRIVDSVKAFGGEVVMTSAKHTSGTDRCAEAAKILSTKYDFDVVVNVQGDEPFIDPAHLELITQCFTHPDTEIATLITPILSTEILFDPNKVKAVISNTGDALYFSRQPIPFQRDIPEAEWVTNHTYYLHVGLYAYRKEVLEQITHLAPTQLEIAEKLEQLRWLEKGYRITTAITSHGNFGIDTPNDFEKIKNLQK